MTILRLTMGWHLEHNQIRLLQEGKAVLTLRASGTEPKLKWYLEVSDPKREESIRLAQLLEEDALKLVST